MAPNRKIDKNYEYKKIAKERSLWLLKPMTVLGVLVWALYPSTVMPGHLDQNATMGFLLGAMAGVVWKMDTFRYYLFVRRHNVTDRKNRMPDEYYFGLIKQVMHVKQEGA